ncbi:hypothetical protein A2U01_0070635, partial [Trifolium medium]|nr:hypothetical protein [Trifolium medium]
ALNEVWFGHFRVRARVARFDRKDPKKIRRTRQEKEGDMINGEGEKPKGKELHREISNGEEKKKKNAGLKTRADGGRDSHGGTGRFDAFERIRVGDVEVGLAA